MKSAEDCNQGTSVLDQGEWLNLSLGRNLPSISKESELHTPTSGKVFSCNFCKRKFYSSEALGGLGMLTRGKRCSKTVSIPEDASATAATFSEASAGYQRTSHTNQMDRSYDLKWPGSFQLNQQQTKDHASNPTKIDLNLKL
ncbi:hypothetical protein HAX54_049754 [Datura stramonium]|uniref:Uncharacterized protein n=1 Tax=Datura stramonium TaxID=4076 RepID=A0ABS8SVD5_DATST|nr:hypothetical protein [Datura stramonium]